MTVEDAVPVEEERKTNAVERVTLPPDRDEGCELLRFADGGVALAQGQDMVYLSKSTLARIESILRSGSA